MNNPGSILKLWTKAVKTHEKDKEPKELAKKGQEHKLKIKKGLTTLKFEGAADMSAPANRERFVLVRDKTAKVMTRYCRYLPSAKDEDKKTLPRYLKTVKQLTVLVMNLEPRGLEQGEDEPSLNSLETVDVAKAEQALTAADTGAEIDFDEPAPPAPPPPPPPPAGDGAAQFTARLKALMPQIQQALAGSAPAGQEIKLRISEANTFARKKDFAQANFLLDRIEALLKATPNGTVPPAPPPPPPGAADGAARFTARLKALMPQIQQALASAAPAGQEIKLRVSEASTFARKKDFAQANALLDQIEVLLKRARGTGGPDLAAEWKKNLAASTGAIKAALVAKGPNAAAIAKLLAQATALAKPGGDMAQALARLAECHALATGGGAAQPGGQSPATRWNSARAPVIAKLQNEIKEIVAAKHPDSPQAELELKAVLKQLTGMLQTRQQATEMERYLSDDDVVADVCALAFDLKTPLLKTLAEITPMLPA